MKMWPAQRLLTTAYTALRTLRTGVVPGMAAAFGLILLSGCHERMTTENASASVQPVVPDTKVLDYRTASCDTIWLNDAGEALSNALYWLRAMDCADRLTGTQARVQARDLSADGWANVFKQSLLIGSAEPSAGERRQMLARLDGYRGVWPSALRPLLQLWREKQMLTISLLEEKGRYQRLQESTDTQLDAMRENQSRLQYRLDDTTRKLENLTDIERQLSSRKQEMQDNGQGQKSDEPAVVKPETGKDDAPAAAEPSAPETAPNESKEH